MWLTWDYRKGWEQRITFQLYSLVSFSRACMSRGQNCQFHHVWYVSWYITPPLPEGSWVLRHAQGPWRQPESHSVAEARGLPSCRHAVSPCLECLVVQIVSFSISWMCHGQNGQFQQVWYVFMVKIVSFTLSGMSRVQNCQFKHVLNSLWSKLSSFIMSLMCSLCLYQWSDACYLVGVLGSVVFDILL
jgi:hypothetical protein